MLFLQLRVTGIMAVDMNAHVFPTKRNMAVDMNAPTFLPKETTFYYELYIDRVSLGSEMEPPWSETQIKREEQR